MWIRIATCMGVVCLSAIAADKGTGKFVEIPGSVLEDKVRGGLIGEMLGDLNGLKHEMKYIDEPGNVTSYKPALPEGAWTDDDTDIEWIYVLKMQSSKEMMLSPQVIADEWR